MNRDYNGLFWPMVQVLLIALKCTGFITWSWLWVLMPLWLTLGAFVAVSFLLIIVMTSSRRKNGRF